MKRYQADDHLHGWWTIQSDTHQLVNNGMGMAPVEFGYRFGAPYLTNSLDLAIEEMERCAELWPNSGLIITSVEYGPTQQQ